MKFNTRTTFAAAILFSFVCCFTACGDDDSTGSLSVEILSPEDGATFSQTDTIELMFRVTDDVDITTIAFTSIGLSTGSVPAAELAGDNDTSFSGSFLFSANVDPGEYTLSVDATDVGMENSASEEIVINIE